MKNYVQRGENITVPATAAVASGEPVVIGALVGIAAGDAEIGADLDMVTAGVFDLPKVGADAFDIGDVAYLDAATKLMTNNDAAGTNPRFGVAVTVAGATTGSVHIRLG